MGFNIHWNVYMVEKNLGCLKGEVHYKTEGCHWKIKVSVKKKARITCQNVLYDSASGGLVKVEIFPPGTYVLDALNLLKILLDSCKFFEYSMLFGIDAIKSQICCHN